MNAIHDCPADISALLDTQRRSGHQRRGSLGTSGGAVLKRLSKTITMPPSFPKLPTSKTSLCPQIPKHVHRKAQLVSLSHPFKASCQTENLKEISLRFTKTMTATITASPTETAQTAFMGTKTTRMT